MLWTSEPDTCLCPSLASTNRWYDYYYLCDHNFFEKMNRYRIYNNWSDIYSFGFLTIVSPWSSSTFSISHFSVSKIEHFRRKINIFFETIFIYLFLQKNYDRINNKNYSKVLWIPDPDSQTHTHNINEVQAIISWMDLSVARISRRLVQTIATNTTKTHTDFA